MIFALKDLFEFMNEVNHVSALESLLFVSGEPLSLARLSEVLSLSEKDVQTAIDHLAKRYNDEVEGGLMLIRQNGTVMLATKPANASHVEALTKSTLQEGMSKAALEVLAIIAYRAPVSRAEIDAILGVNCSFTLRNLLLRDLIEREGNPSDSRGYLYRPTVRFLQVLGIQEVSELPQYELLSRDERLRLVLEQDGKKSEEENEIGENGENKTETE